MPDDFKLTAVVSKKWSVLVYGHYTATHFSKWSASLGPRKWSASVAGRSYEALVYVKWLSTSMKRWIVRSFGRGDS